MRKGPRGKATGTQQGLQTVFRIKGTKARERTSNPNSAQKSAFSARRSHKKSRTGCQNCKQRRVKCDENREGGCDKCRAHGVDCDYLICDVVSDEISTTPDQRTPPSTALTISNSSSAAMSPLGAGSTALTPYLHPPTPLKYNVPPELTSYWQTLRHFELFTCPTITSADGLRIFEGSVLAIANNSDYLMHAVLGTAAAHLAWKADLCGAYVEHTRHRRTEAYHWQRAIGMFRARLDCLDQRTSETVDALISTCMLLGIHSYYSSDDRDGVSFVWRPVEERSNALRWLSVQSGFGLLLRALGGRAALSAWLQVFQSAVPGEAGFLIDVNTASGIYRDFLDICAIDTESTPQNNVYMLALQDLFALLQMGRPSMKSFAPLMAFMGRLVGSFQELLIRRDHAAMLMVAYWLTLMQQLDLWWIQQRSEREYTAIVNYLQDSTDLRVQRLLNIVVQCWMSTQPDE